MNKVALAMITFKGRVRAGDTVTFLESPAFVFRGMYLGIVCNERHFDILDLMMQRYSMFVTDEPIPAEAFKVPKGYKVIKNENDEMLSNMVRIECSTIQANSMIKIKTKNNADMELDFEAHLYGMRLL